VWGGGGLEFTLTLVRILSPILGLQERLNANKGRSKNLGSNIMEMILNICFMHHSCLRNVMQTELICFGGLLQE